MSFLYDLPQARTAVTKLETILLSLNHVLLDYFIKQSLKISKFKSKKIIKDLNKDKFFWEWMILEKVKLHLNMTHQEVKMGDCILQ